MTLSVVANGTTSVWFDIVGIDIHTAEYKDDGNDWKLADFNITTPNSNIGDALEV